MALLHSFNAYLHDSYKGPLVPLRISERYVKLPAMEQRNVLVMISPMSGPRLAGVARYAKEHGWYLMVQDRLGYQPPVWRGDGMLVTLRTDAATADLVKRVRRNGMPVVDLTVNRPDIRLPRVTSDHAAIGRLAAEHFAARDFRHAAWFSLGWTHVHTLRFDALAATCRRLGMDVPLKWAYTDMVPAAHLGNWRTFARTLGARLVSAPKPLAVLTYDEADAVRLLAVCREQSNSVPVEVAILSIGNDPILCENAEPRLSSIQPDFTREGYLAAQILDRGIGSRSGETVSVGIRQIVHRESTYPLSHSGRLVQKALAWIDRNAARRISVADVARRLGVSRSLLDLRFRELQHETVHDAIVRRRLALLKSRLLTSHASIAEVSADCGWGSLNAAKNLFRRRFGTTMRDFRRQASHP